MSGKIRGILFVVVIVGMMFLGLFDPHQSPVLAQQPTGSIPTVTSTPEGPVVTVFQNFPVVHVYAGPSIYDYPSVGVMLANESAPAIGRAKDRKEWIQIRYLGVPGSTAWIYASWVSLSPGALLPTIDIPPTPTPFATPTIDPVLEAAYIGQQTPTRLPTFTPPPPLDVPRFTDAPGASTRGVPAGLLIVSLGLFGFLGAVISYLRGR
jgi:hypothetical protein